MTCTYVKIVPSLILFRIDVVKVAHLTMEMHDFFNLFCRAAKLGYGFAAAFRLCRNISRKHWKSRCKLPSAVVSAEALCGKGDNTLLLQK